MSATLSGPSLLDVTTSVCPASSKNFLRPNSPETQPSNSPGLKSIALGLGTVVPSGYLSTLGRLSSEYEVGIPSVGSSYKIHNTFIVYSYYKFAIDSLTISTQVYMLKNISKYKKVKK